MPHPAKNGPTFAEGRHAIVVNVFTEPEWRRQGVAAMHSGPMPGDNVRVINRGQADMDFVGYLCVHARTIHAASGAAVPGNPAL
jgi:hypothetical protein